MEGINPDIPPAVPIELDALTQPELDELLDKLMGTITLFMQYNLGKQYGVIVGIGTPGGYRGTVTNVTNNTDQLGDVIIQWGQNVKSGQKEW